MRLILKYKGGEGSGHYGHAGRVGGSVSRNPYAGDTGYLASRKNKITGDYNVLYEASEQGLDATDGKYVNVCMGHKTTCNFATKSAALSHLPYADWCEECQLQV